MTVRNDIISYREMCDLEGAQTLQRGMNYRLRPTYSVFLMSVRPGAPYKDSLQSDGLTIEYEGHDTTKKSPEYNPKSEDQPRFFPSGGLTQNGRFSKAVDDYKAGRRSPELVKVYEKIATGIWSLKGVFSLLDYMIIGDGQRKVFRFILKLVPNAEINAELSGESLGHTRLIPSAVKVAVYKRDKGRCAICGSTKNLHYDHDYPYSKGGTSLSADNIRLLCMEHNLAKSSKIE